MSQVGKSKQFFSIKISSMRAYSPPNFTPLLPRQFQATYKPGSMLATLKPQERKLGSTSAICSVSNIQINPKLVAKHQAQKQRKEILDWLSTDNPPAVDLLSKVSKCATPYSKLLTESVEELSFIHAPTRSQKIDDLERESALNSAKMEVEIQQQQEKLTKVKNEKQQLLDKIKKANARLDKVNKDVSLLQSLFVYQGIDNSSESNKQQVILSEETLEKPKPVLDQELYRDLWKTRQELLDQIEELQKNLTKTQQMQVEEMQAVCRRRVKAQLARTGI